MRILGSSLRLGIREIPNLRIRLGISSMTDNIPAATVAHHENRHRIAVRPDRTPAAASRGHESHPERGAVHIGAARPRCGGWRGSWGVGVLRATNDSLVLGDVRPRAKSATGELSSARHPPSGADNLKPEGPTSPADPDGRRPALRFGHRRALMNRTKHRCRRWAGLSRPMSCANVARRRGR
jgi:hypothetical protein